MTREEIIQGLYRGDSKAIKEAIKALEQQPCEDTISRADAVKVASGYCHPANIAKELAKLPPVQPKYNAEEWCHDCKEYDRDKHCCPRFNRVIRNAVEEVKKPKTGHWIEYTRVLTPEPINKWEQAWYCSECGYGNQECEDGSAWLEWKYCPNCGKRMIEPQESEEQMTLEEINTMKYRVCCPMCDNKKCVRGTDSCEAEQWAKSKALGQEPIDYKTQYENYLKKSEVVISQLRADRDRLRDAFEKVRTEIADLADSDAYGDYQQGFNFGLMRAVQVIDKYKTESEDRNDTR